jgi:hypothetical protein
LALLIASKDQLNLMSDNYGHLINRNSWHLYLCPFSDASPSGNGVLSSKLETSAGEGPRTHECPVANFLISINGIDAQTPSIFSYLAIKGAIAC